MRIFANLLSVWTDITDDGTIERGQDPTTYFKEFLKYDDGQKIATCFEYDYINVEHNGKNYRIHPSMIQFVS